MEYKYKIHDPNKLKFYQSYLHFQKLPTFAGLCPTVVVELGVDTGSDESRGGGRGRKAVISEKLREEK